MGLDNFGIVDKEVAVMSEKFMNFDVIGVAKSDVISSWNFSDHDILR